MNEPYAYLQSSATIECDQRTTFDIGNECLDETEIGRRHLEESFEVRSSQCGSAIQYTVFHIIQSVWRSLTEALPKVECCTHPCYLLLHARQMIAQIGRQSVVGVYCLNNLTEEDTAPLLLSIQHTVPGTLHVTCTWTFCILNPDSLTFRFKLDTKNTSPCPLFPAPLSCIQI